MNKTYIIILVLVGVAVVGLLVWNYVPKSTPVKTVTNFEECTKAGYPVMYSYPAQCRTPDDKIFTEVISKKTTPLPTQLKKITNFEECANAGYPIMQSYPRQCSVPGGGNFVEKL